MQKFFIKVSQKIEENTFFRHLFFALATIFTISLLGYYFGTFDQVSHIPFLKKNYDPTLYPGDIYFILRSSHYSFFWLFFIPFYHFGVLEVSMFIIHVLVTYFTFWSIYRLTKTLFNDPLTSFLATITFIVPHVSFSGFTLFEFSLLNRTFVLPFLLLAIDCYLKKNYWISYLILGLMYNLHAVSGNFILAMFLFDGLLRFKKIGLKNFFISVLFFFVLASPIFIWKSTNSHLDFSINLKWYGIIKNGILSHIFDITAINPPVIFLTLGGLTSIFIFFIIKKHFSDPKHEIIQNYIFAGLIILFTQIITSYFFPLTIIIQAQIIRVGIFLLIFSYLFFCNFISQQVKKGKIDNNQFFLFLTALLFSVSPLLLIMVLLTYRSKKCVRFITGISIILSIIMFVIIARLDLWKPGIHIYPNKLKGYQLQSWVKKNTPKEAVFITPPHLWWFYNLDWRIVSERTTIVTLSELLEAAFEPKYIDNWQARFNDIAPQALSKFKGNAFDNFFITKKAYYSLSDKDIKRIAKKYQATYFIVEKPYTYPFVKIYEDNQFYLYKID